MSLDNRKERSLYAWLEEHFIPFLMAIGMTKAAAESYRGLITAHGDKTHQYQTGWEEAGVDFKYGTLIYLLSFISPYSNSVRDTTAGGWVSPPQWVIDNYLSFLPAIAPINLETLTSFSKKVDKMSEDELRVAATWAFYHLHVVCGSRNSVEGSEKVENMHHLAAKFIFKQHGV